GAHGGRRRRAQVGGPAGGDGGRRQQRRRHLDVHVVRPGRRVEPLRRDRQQVLGVGQVLAGRRGDVQGGRLGAAPLGDRLPRGGGLVAAEEGGEGVHVLARGRHGHGAAGARVEQVERVVVDRGGGAEGVCRRGGLAAGEVQGYGRLGRLRARHG